MFEKWITDGSPEIPWVIISGVATYLGILIYTRFVGLRSLSKMSAADFVMTIAVGSLFASTVSLAKPSLSVGLTALAVLYAGQWVMAWSRRQFRFVGKLIDNEPLLLMAGRTILEDNLERANVTRADLFGKLREANAFNYDQVLAVVFETTGDISVLHSADSAATLEPDFFQSVVDSDRLFPDLARNDSLSEEDGNPGAAD